MGLSSMRERRGAVRFKPAHTLSLTGLFDCCGNLRFVPTAKARMHQTHDAVLVDHVARGHGRRLVLLRQGLALVPRQRKAHARVLGEGFDSVRLVVLADPDDLERTAVTLRESLINGERLLARLTPGRP